MMDHTPWNAAEIPRAAKTSRTRPPNPRIEEGEALAKLNGIIELNSLSLVKVAEKIGVKPQVLYSWRCGSITFGPARLALVQNFLYNWDIEAYDSADLQDAAETPHI